MDNPIDENEDFVNRIADAVVARMEERRRLVAIADYIIMEMEQRQRCPAGCAAAQQTESTESRPTTGEAG